MDASLTFSIRLSYLCAILIHNDCSVIYLKQNVTPKYYIKNKSTIYLYSNIKYEACNVMKRSQNLMIQCPYIKLLISWKQNITQGPTPLAWIRTALQLPVAWVHIEQVNINILACSNAEIYSPR